jgi:isopenicillin N synthase-like dioxygenase
VTDSEAGTSQIPVIDVGPLVTPGPDARALRQAASRIGEACRDVGFFYITNHGIPEPESEALLAEAKRFFGLPAAEKMKLRLGQTSQFRGFVPVGGEVTAGKTDWHECLDLQPLSGRDATSIAAAAAQRRANGRHPLDDPGQWPSCLPSFPAAMMRAWDQRYRLGARIAAGMALSLGLDPDFFAAFAGVELSDLRLIHYPPSSGAALPGPPASGDEDYGFGAHVDYGFLAILQQDGVGGLELRNSAGAWIPAPHIPGTFLVNIGQMMQRWTNDRYRATWHRVRLPAADRYTIAFFAEPSFNAVIEPLDTCCDDGNPPRYEPCQFGPYVVELFSKAYD